ncbi:hypothetical protein G6364_17840 [Vibrio cholerae]
MAILELYSTRNKDVYPDTYQYSYPSEKLRVQVARIIGDAIGIYERYSNGITNPTTCSHLLFQDAFDLITKEYGEERSHGHSNGSYKWAKSLLNNEDDVDRFLDALELFCTLILTKVRDDFYRFKTEGGVVQDGDDAINELNERMKRDGFGYEYSDGIIIRVDQNFLHSEVTKPALYMLSDFVGARSEFLNAHEHYRHERYEEALNDCNKALESLLKEICDAESWEYKKGTISALIPICMERGLFPSYLQTQFSQLANLITQGVSTIRNNESAHGRGSGSRKIPHNLVSYALHLTAINIVFLSECYKNLER